VPSPEMATAPEGAVADTPRSETDPLEVAI
jgi:hypothetical protein